MQRFRGWRRSAGADEAPFANCHPLLLKLEVGTLTSGIGNKSHVTTYLQSVWTSRKNVNEYKLDQQQNSFTFMLIHGH